VINFKTRKNYQGAEVSANVGQNEKGDGGSYNVSLTAGFGDIDKDGQNLLLTIDAFKRTPLWSNKHAYYANPDHRQYGGRQSQHQPVSGQRAWPTMANRVMPFRVAVAPWAPAPVPAIRFASPAL
jgi:hypothetical protein